MASRDAALPPFVRIEAVDDPRVSDFRNVPDPVLVRQRGLFVAEGRFVVRRLLAARRFRLRALLVTETALSRLADDLLVDGLEAPIYVTTRPLLRDLGGYEFHQGCLGLAERPRPRLVDEVIEAADPRRPLVILERVGNPDNIGGIFRNAAALGAGGVLLSPGCGDPLYRKAIRTSIGATLHVPYAVVDEWPLGLREIRHRGFAVIGLTPATSADTLDRLQRTGPGGVAFVCGNEGDGLTEEALTETDARVRIPIEPAVDSLNVATAAAIALHYWRAR